jgi:adenine-specific DNA-methyltransferase
MCGLIPFKKTSGQASTLIAGVCDFLLWYGKDKDQTKYQQLYSTLGEDVSDDSYNCVELEDGTWRRLTAAELRGDAPIPQGKRFRTANLTSQGWSEEGSAPFEFQGKTYSPSRGTHWKPGTKKLPALAAANRLIGIGNTLAYKRYIDDFPGVALTNMWNDTVESTFVAQKIYAVQTAQKVVQRCVLMTSAPGDLVLDITCGSGTTAFVAEMWGRRWITVDTSRVPIALARQRLLTSTYPWYKLKVPAQGPAGGFVYERRRNRKGDEVGGLVPRITLSSVANQEEPGFVMLADRPEVLTGVTRVSGPFAVEATIQATLSLEEESGPQARQVAENPRSYLDRMIEVLRQSKTLQLPGNVTLQLEGISPLADREYLHAEGVAKNGSDKRIAFVFGPEDGAIGSQYVYDAHTEALQQGFQQLFLFGFAIDPKAREMLSRLKVPTTYVSVTPDVIMSDLLKTARTSEIFSITGLPDVSLEPAGKEKDGTPLHRVVIKGLDIFRPDTMETEEVAAENLPCWMLDSNYNGMVFMATQAFFPKTGAWENLQKSLKGQFSDDVWEHLAGTVSEPFVLGDKKRIAVKAIDERGNELMVVKSAEGSR